jgi:hypothetical protein
MFLLLSIISFLYILRLRLKEILLIFLLGVLALNFTFLTQPKILRYQEDQLAKVDARNYYQTISTIIKSSKLDRSVLTNFQPITTERILRDINFIYSEDNKIKELLQDSTKAKDVELFICLKTIDSITKNDLTKDISNKKIKILYNDSNYIFCKLIK